jgi:hypothetical protein
MLEAKYLRWALGMLPLWLCAQTDLDAERWSGLMPQGTARGLAMGGAFSALGGDPTNLTQNPAGLGLFTRGGLWLSPTRYISTTQTTYNQQTSSDSRTHFGLNHLSLILRVTGGKNITQWTFGFGYNQEGFFYQNATARAFNNRNSFTQAIAEQAEGIPSFNLGGLPVLAYFNNLRGLADLAYFNSFDLGAPLGTRGVIYLADTSRWRYRGVFSEGGVFQEITSQEKGYLNAWAISGALSYQNRIFFGVSLLMRSLSHSKLYRLREIDEENRYNGQNSTTPADAVALREWYRATGTGRGLALGILVEPVDFMRFGVSFTTGSRIRISNEYTAETELSLDDGRSNIVNFSDLPDGVYSYYIEYHFEYPSRATAGVAFLISGRGAVSIEADFLDYRTMSFSSSDYAYDRENETIEKSFGTAVNVRGGIEWLLTDEIAVRGGYAYFGPQRNADGRKYYADMTQPQNLTTLPMQRQFFSLGAGYKAGRFFIDIAYLLGLYAQKYLPYSLRDPAYAPAPVVVIRNQTHFIVTTLGFRFGGS